MQLYVASYLQRMAIDTASNQSIQHLHACGSWGPSNHLSHKRFTGPWTLLVEKTYEYSLHLQVYRQNEIQSKDVGNSHYSGSNGSGLLSMFCSNLHYVKWNCLDLKLTKLRKNHAGFIQPPSWQKGPSTEKHQILLNGQIQQVCFRFIKFKISHETVLTLCIWSTHFLFSQALPILPGKRMNTNEMTNAGNTAREIIDFPKQLNYWLTLKEKTQLCKMA